MSTIVVPVSGPMTALAEASAAMAVSVSPFPLSTYVPAPPANAAW